MIEYTLEHQLPFRCWCSCKGWESTLKISITFWAVSVAPPISSVNTNRYGEVIDEARGSERISKRWMPTIECHHKHQKLIAGEWCLALIPSVTEWWKRRKHRRRQKGGDDVSAGFVALIYMSHIFKQTKAFWTDRYMCAEKLTSTLLKCHMASFAHKEIQNFTLLVV